MSQSFIYATGFPDDHPGMPVMPKVSLIVTEDAAVAQGTWMLGFSGRQSALGFRQPGAFTRPPETQTGALIDILGS